MLSGEKKEKATRITITLKNEAEAFFKDRKWQRLEKAVKNRAELPTDADIALEIFEAGVKSLRAGKGVVGAALPKEKRVDALKLWKEGKSVKEISEKTGVKVKTVQTWLRREKARQAKKAEKQKQPEQVEGAQVKSA
jgi:DNA-directed RNA polymerase specialized sigma24 family protein